MVQVKMKRCVPVLLLALTLTVVGSGSARAGTTPGDSVAGQTFVTCGEVLLRLRDFGKLAVDDYNSYVPENFQATPGVLMPSFTFIFNAAPGNGFVMAFSYPNQLGQPVNTFVTGTFEQKGSKVDMLLNANGQTALETTFRALSDNMLFGNRALVTDFPYASLTNPDSLHFKGKVKNGNLKVKFNARMRYDIQFEILSDEPDVFNARGTMRLRAQTKTCPPPG